MEIKENVKKCCETIKKTLGVPTNKSLIDKQHKKISINTISISELREYVVVLTRSDVSIDVLAGIRYYTNLGYMEMNAYERYKNNKKNHYTLECMTDKEIKDIEKRNNTLEKELEKHIVKKPIVVYKGISYERLNMMTNAQLKLDGSNLSHLVGRVIRDRGFVSTTIDESKSFYGEYKLIIDVPIGALGAYIADISTVSSEKEFLLNKDQSMIITGISKKENLKLVKCRLIV